MPTIYRRMLVYSRLFKEQLVFTMVLSRVRGGLWETNLLLPAERREREREKVTPTSLFDAAPHTFRRFAQNFNYE